MARNAFELLSLLVAVFCLLQVATANLGQDIQAKANKIVQNEHLSCSSYAAYCDSHEHAFADVKDTSGTDVSSAICKVALGVVLGC